ncbi:MAG TPA: GNAT family N-acetyltransferase [Gemmatimonadaceae bacterium]
MSPRLAVPRPEHRHELRELLEATELFREEEVGVALELFDDGISGRDPDYHWLAALEGDRLLGAACWGPTPATEGAWDLYWIAVHPDAQGQGIGTTLLGAAEDAVGRARGRLLVVETSGRPAYAPTRNFYRRRGYGEAARLDDFYAPGDARVTFVKRLAAGPPGHDPSPTAHAEQPA